MKVNNKLFSVFLLLALLLVPARAAHAKGLHDGRVVFGDDYTLKKGETLDAINQEILLHSVDARPVNDGDVVEIVPSIAGG